jgi:RHS repeat-associated protein
MRPATLAYDLAGRVVDASVGIYDFAYAYDGLQNMVARTIDAPIGAPLPRVETGVYVYGSGSGPRQLARVESAGGQVSRSYDRDDAGRLVAIHDAAQTTLIDYDAFDRQRRVSLAGGLELEYAYGADGERITSFAPGVDDAAPLLDAQGIAVPAATPGASFGALRFGADASLEKGRLDVYVRLGERPLARVVVDVINASAPAELTYLHTTFGPGPTLITAPDGQVLEERFFEPFGALLLANRPDLSDPQTPGLIADSDAATAFSREAMGWLNKPHDPRTGWSDHGARWMAPEIGQWMTPDPPVKVPDARFVQSPWDLHPYQYASQNPVVYWDPDGEAKQISPSEAARRISEYYPTLEQVNLIPTEHGFRCTSCGPNVSISLAGTVMVNASSSAQARLVQLEKTSSADDVQAAMEVQRDRAAFASAASRKGSQLLAETAEYAAEKAVQYGTETATLKAIGVAFTGVRAARGIASSRKLGRALEAAGHVRPPNSHAHHIVAGGAPAAERARGVLERFGIGINDAANGVFLPAAYHRSMHDGAYYTMVNRLLGAATSRAEAEAALGAIRDALLSGGP